MKRVRIVGAGRVGGALRLALAASGWDVVGSLGRADDPTAAARDVELVLVTTPDGAIATVAGRIAVEPGTVVAHCSGAQTLDVLAPHPRVGSLHPLLSVSDALTGAERLRSGCAFALDGDPLLDGLVADLGGRAFRVPAEARAMYHAAAVIASNHLVALFGQVERIAAQAGVPVDAYVDLARQTLDNVERLGPAAALTGPVARGDWATVCRHLRAIDPSERAAYEALAEQANRLCGRAETLAEVMA